jgi:hypothetical protein
VEKVFDGKGIKELKGPKAKDDLLYSLKRATPNKSLSVVQMEIKVFYFG